MHIDQALTCLIVEDEPIAAERIAALLHEYSFIQLHGICTNGLEALSMLSHQVVDMMFVDIDMPRMDGMTMVRSLPIKERPHVIFATAYDEFAVQAFDLFAIDYLLKPFSKERFRLCMQKVLLHIRNLRFSQEQQLSGLYSLMDTAHASDFSSQHLSVKLGKRTYFLPILQIEYICSAGNYLEIFAQEKIHVIRETMSRIQEILPAHFVRIHKSNLINLSYLQELIALGEGDYSLKMQNGVSLRISDTYKKEILKLLKK